MYSVWNTQPWKSDQTDGIDRVGIGTAFAFAGLVEVVEPQKKIEASPG